MTQQQPHGELERALREAVPGRETNAVPQEDNTRLAARAATEGLLDVAYATVDTPHGEMLVAATDRGLVRAALPNTDRDAVLAEIAAAISPRVLEAPQRLDRVRRELEAYFEGRLRRFTVPLDWRLARGFRARALRAIAAIPYGGTRSYAEVAAEAGSPRAFRAAGTACGANPLPPIVPCHRVLPSGGGIGAYGGGPDLKEALLRLEGAI